MTDHAIKLNRARARSRIGDNPETYAALSRHVPPILLERGTAAMIAATIDALYACGRESKRLARREDLDAGCIWDERAARHREIGA